MLRWMKSERSDHPLDSKDPSGALLEQISGKDPIPALEQICAHLDAVKTAENLKPGRALEIVDLLDRTGRPLQRRLNHELVSEGHRMGKRRFCSMSRSRPTPSVLSPYRIEPSNLSVLTTCASDARALRSCAKSKASSLNGNVTLTPLPPSARKFSMVARKPSSGASRRWYSRSCPV